MRAGGAGVMAPGAGAVTPDAVALVNSGEQVQARAVVESDIWKISGDTLYFFNQYRGLQVIDISQPDAPAIRGALAITAAGEQMYLLDDTHVVLLARDACNPADGAESQALVVEIKDANPTIIAVARMTAPTGARTPGVG